MFLLWLKLSATYILLPQQPNLNVIERKFKRQILKPDPIILESEAYLKTKTKQYISSWSWSSYAWHGRAPSGYRLSRDDELKNVVTLEARLDTCREDKRLLRGKLKTTGTDKHSDNGDTVTVWLQTRPPGTRAGWRGSSPPSSAVWRTSGHSQTSVRCFERTWRAARWSIFMNFQ